MKPWRSVIAFVFIVGLWGCPFHNENCRNGIDDDSDNLPDCLDDECTGDRACRGCGDGIVDDGEECDDGNIASGDGCENDCTATPPICGNGVVEAPEECDDGNLIDDDGCSSACTPDVATIDGLDVALGCQGVFNPNQLLDYHVTMSSGDFNSLKNDASNSVFFPASFHCEDGSGATPEQNIGIRRKRSGSTDKPGLKLDFNLFVAGGNFFGLNKVSLENGISEGSSSGSGRDIMAEYLGWRIMVLSGALSSRAALVRLFVNGQLIGVYTHVEQLNKRFLQVRLGDDSGWLFKHSGGADGYKTNETLQNPFEDALCFLPGVQRQGCASTPSPAEAEAYLLAHVEVTQLLLMGGVNALIANTDSPIVKDNNYYFYDSEFLPRVYFPWDLDTTMKNNPSIFETGTGEFTDFLFPAFEDDLDNLMTELVEGPLSLAAILAEIDRVFLVGGAAIDADPLAGGAQGAVDTLKSFWNTRHPQVVAELAAH